MPPGTGEAPVLKRWKAQNPVAMTLELELEDESGSAREGRGARLRLHPGNIVCVRINRGRLRGIACIDPADVVVDIGRNVKYCLVALDRSRIAEEAGDQVGQDTVAVEVCGRRVVATARTPSSSARPCRCPPAFPSDCGRLPLLCASACRAGWRRSTDSWAGEGLSADWWD